MKNILLHFLFLFLTINTAFSTNYYFSTSGNDSNSGTSTNSPFKSTDKLISLQLFAGDSILFKKGEVFVGNIMIKQSGTIAQPIVISSYGTGSQLSILTGASSLRNWSVYSQNTKLYTTTLPSTVKQLYSNDKLLDLARYPNAPNYLYANSGMTVGNVQQFSPTTLTQTSGYWVGATVKYRANNWAWEYRKITGFSNGNISYFPDTRYAVAGGNDFFIENKFEQLDAKNEWFYNTTSKQLFLYPESASTMTTANIKAVLFDNAVKLDSLVSNITISNIIFDKYSGNGIYGTARNSNVRIENCAFQNIEEMGVKFYRKANNCFVNNCFFMDVRGRGISFVESYKNTISNNTLKRIGMLPGRGISGVNGYVGIVCEIRDESRNRVLDQFDSISNHNIVRHNTIDSTGYIGIRVDGQYNTVEKNIINHAMLTMDDGGGLYCYNTITKSSIISNNFVMNSATQASITNGIYIDNNAYDMSVINNTVLNIPGAGVLINAEAHDNIVRSNVLFNNYIGVCFSDWGTTAIYGNKIYKNTIVSNSSGYPAIQINSNTGRYNVAVADSNYFVNPHTDNIFQYMWNQNSNFNLATWRTKVPYNDIHSVALTTNSSPKATAGNFFLFTNKTDNLRTVDLTGCGCTDLKSNSINQLELPAFSSQVLIKDPTKCTGIVNDTPFLLPNYTWPSKGYDNAVYAGDNYIGFVSVVPTVSSNQNFTIFPNPITRGGLLTVEGKGLDINNCALIISDLTGKILHKTQLSAANTIDLNGLNSGVYFLSIQNDKYSKSFKLVVK